MSAASRMRVGAAACVAAMVSAPVWAGTLGGAPDDGISYGRVLAALALCLVLAGVGAVVLRARIGGVPVNILSLPGPRRLQVVETVRLSQTATLSIVQCDGREVLVLAAGEGGGIVDRLPVQAAE